MVFRCIAPEWLMLEAPSKAKVLEGEFDDETLKNLNADGYNIYFLPNHPALYDSSGGPVSGHHIDTFRYVFVDMDLKEGKWRNKEIFLNTLVSPKPTLIVDSGNGVHAYWEVADLDALSFLRLQRRLARHFVTDLAVSKIYQLMRAPGYYNTKNRDNLKPCQVILETSETYSCESLDRLLPILSKEDEDYCKNHYEKTYRLNQTNTKVDDRLPIKFGELIKNNNEVKNIWSGNTDDRSTADYRLGHIMLASGFTKEEAISVLVNSAKAMSRAPTHRINYAANIVDKIWTFEETPDLGLNLHRSVRDILEKSGNAIKGERFPCWSYLDATEHGFRLGQVIGLVAGSGVGKTAMALNMFMGFVQSNPDYDHFFIPLEQPANEIADRWKTMCGDNTSLYDKVHVLSNYDENGAFLHLSLDEIRTYLLKFQKVTGKKVGCVVIDHVGALKKKSKEGEAQGLMDICHAMKAFAIETNTMLVMQSQAPREKAGIGDLELNKDAAYGTVYFESYCDYLVTIWQPLKRCYAEDGCPTVTAFKFCKIRHKKQGIDKIQEDSSYLLYFDPRTEHLRTLTTNEHKSFDFFNTKATNKRKSDRKTDVMVYSSIGWDVNGKTDSNQDVRGVKEATLVLEGQGIHSLRH